MVGSGIRASDFYDKLIPNQRASSRLALGYKEEIETLKQVNHDQNRQLQEQSKQIQEQNKQIQELLKISKQRFEYMESSSQANVVPSSSYQIPNHRQNSISSTRTAPQIQNHRQNPNSSTTTTSLKVGMKVCLKSVLNPSHDVAIGWLDYLDPKTLVDDTELGKNMVGVQVTILVDMTEELVRPIYQFTTIGEVIGNVIAWPRSLVVEVDD